MIKNLYCFFAKKLCTLLSFLIGCWGRHVCVCVCVCVRVCLVGMKGIRGKLLKYLDIWVVLLWGHPQHK